MAGAGRRPAAVVWESGVRRYRPGMARRFSPDFRRFWAGQTVFQLGSSFTQFATPLLVYKLTHSAVNLGVATAAEFVPYLLFGLVIGAWPEAPLKAPDWRGPAGTQADDDRRRPGPGRRHCRHPPPGGGRAPPGVGGLRGRVHQFDADHLLRGRPVRRHPEPGRRRRPDLGEREDPGDLLGRRRPRAAAGGAADHDRPRAGAVLSGRLVVRRLGARPGDRP